MVSKRMSMLEAINLALDDALKRESRALVFGSDVSEGGVFRCSQGLQHKYGKARVFNTPLCEQGIAGFAIGLASNGWKPIAEIQFADYIFPAFDQLLNEAAKYRFRSGGEFNCGGLVVRAPCGTMGHGGLYHSQSPEAYICHTPGVKVVMPSNPADAYNLLKACIKDENPCLFLEPKALYRNVMDCDLDGDQASLCKAKILKRGSHLTIITYGQQVHKVMHALSVLDRIRPSLSLEVVDLRTLLPYDLGTIVESVKRTGRILFTHESPETCSISAEIISRIASDCFAFLHAPPTRVCGFDAPVPHINEYVHIPNEDRLLKKIVEICSPKECIECEL